MCNFKGRFGVQIIYIHDIVVRRDNLPGEINQRSAEFENKDLGPLKHYVSRIILYGLTVILVAKLYQTKLSYLLINRA